MLSDCDNKELSQKFFVTVFKFFLWLRRDLNLRPWAYESPALTTELLSQVFQQPPKYNTLALIIHRPQRDVAGLFDSPEQ